MAYTTPGVYVEYVSSGSAPIAGSGTSTAALIGKVPAAVVEAAKFRIEPCTNFSEYRQAFGETDGENKVAFKSAMDDGSRKLAHAVQGFFGNGGTKCYVVAVSDVDGLDNALEAMAAIDEIAIVAAPGCDDFRTKVVDHCANVGDRYAILDCIKDATKDNVAADKATFANEDAAFYFPWLQVADPTPTTKGALESVPPSGHLAGVYARVDAERGVHKAPANEVVRGAMGLTAAVSSINQGTLNEAHVNCIRFVNGAYRVWGARTSLTGTNDWRYVNVRRMFLFLRESIDEGTQWAVFEPNTPDLWAKITRNISAFLTNLWNSGALFGTTAQEAFYVKCDAETNPPDQRDLGRVITEIGVALVKPAEFVIFRVTQTQGTGA